MEAASKRKRARPVAEEAECPSGEGAEEADPPQGVQKKPAAESSKKVFKKPAAKK